jgi:hypothetical protein
MNDSDFGKINDPKTPSTANPSENRSTRRRFLGQVGAALAGGALLGKLPPAAAQSLNPKISDGVEAPAGTRVEQAFQVRVQTAAQEARIPISRHTANGDEQRYLDKSGSYSKCLLQDGIGLVNLNSWASFKTALDSGRFGDFEKLIMGGSRTMNGPMGSYGFALEGSDYGVFGSEPSPANQISQIVVPPAPALASEAYGTELIEMYWASLLRDVSFSNYGSDPGANAAARELTNQPTYAGPRDGTGRVTPDLLFRGGYPGEMLGPYVSQFMLQPTSFGAQPISQQLTTYLSGIDYMTDLETFQRVQNGIDTGLQVQIDPVLRYLDSGRDLGAFTHVDVLFQAYFVAFLVMATMGVPLNPGNPYNGSTRQNGFGTFGGPDFAASLCAVARPALNSVWYQKWVVHLRHRPESGGAIVRQILQGLGHTLMGRVHDNVLNSRAVQASFERYGDYFLSMAYPEGSPSHPAYPTGHGTVAGACITVLKFFFDGDFVIQNPVVPTPGGLSLVAYTGGDTLTVNGELNKLAHNVSFGHGILDGVHWRSDTDSSIQLGEAVAISVLQDRARTYKEPFTVRFTKIDGTTATISNQ